MRAQQLFYQKEIWKDKFDLILYIDLKKICHHSNKLDFYEFFFDEYLLEYSEPQIITNALKELNENRKILWILDGYEQLEMLNQNEQKENSFASQNAQKIIEMIFEKESKILKNVLITSSKKYSVPGQFVCMEMLGFNEEQKIKYIESYFESSPSLKTPLLELMKNNGRLDQMLSVPLYLEIICLAYESKDNFFDGEIKIRDSPLLLYLSSHLKNDIPFLFTVLGVFFENFFVQEFDNVSDHVPKILSELFNHIEGTENNDLIFKFLQKFKTDTLRWMNSILFEFSINLNLVKYFVQKNYVSLQNDEGNTALYLACQSKQISLEIIKYLVEKKSDLNLKYERGNTLLHLACQNKHISLEIIEYLIEKGSVWNCENNGGDTPSNLIEQNKKLKSYVSRRFGINQKRIPIILDHLSRRVAFRNKEDLIHQRFLRKK